MRIKSIKPYLRDVKRLSKRYKSLTSDLKNLYQDLLDDPQLGQSLGNDCYKIRLKITSKGKGKSSGARVITCVKIVQDTIYTLAIYDKSEKETITDDELDDLMKLVPKE